MAKTIVLEDDEIEHLKKAMRFALTMIYGDTRPKIEETRKRIQRIMAKLVLEPKGMKQ